MSTTRYSYKPDQNPDGTWTVRFHELPEVGSVTAESFRKVQDKSFWKLVTFLQEKKRNHQPIPKDETRFHRVDLGRLHKYHVPEEYSKVLEIR